MTDPRPPDSAHAPAQGAGAAAHAAGTSVRDGPPPSRPRLPLSPRHYLWIVAAALTIILALHWLGRVLTPFLIGAILAYLGTPLVETAERRNIPRGVATTIVIALFGLALLAVFLVLVPLVQAEVGLAAKRLPELVARASAEFTPWLQDRLGVKIAFNLDSLRMFITENVQSAHDLSLRVLSGVKTGGLIVVSVLVNVALVPVVMFYLLRDWKMIGHRMGELVPWNWRGKAGTIVREIDEVLAEFLRGQLAVMVVLAAYYAIGLWIAGLDRAFAIGILTGLLVFIPYVGYGLGLTLGVVAALLQWSGWPAFIGVLAVYGIGQLLENYALVPWLVGTRIGLHPLAVIFALLAFGQLFGFAGVLLALPASAALLVGLRHLRAAYLVSPIYRGGH
jgi:predicted PurR-regulated permease PerM